MDDDVLSKITKKMMEDYETIRSSATVNMFDYYGVMSMASLLHSPLRNLSLDDYKILLMNFSDLMKHYGIIQKH